MKVTYRGCEVDAHRARSMGGETALYYSIFRKSDGFEVTSGFSYGTDKIKDFVGYLKDIVDDFHTDPQAYGPAIIESEERRRNLMMRRLMNGARNRRPQIRERARKALIKRLLRNPRLLLPLSSCP